MLARGFTLIEAIVVIVLLGIVAGLAAPRLVNNESRRAEAAVEATAGVLGVIAQRETLGTVRAALVYDAEERTLWIDRLDLPTDDEGRAEGLGRRESGTWRRDPLVRAVALGPVRVESVRVDGEEPFETDWRIEFVPGEPRPLIELDLVANIGGRERAWLVELLPYATEAERRRTGAGAARTRDGLRSQDLDELGLSEIPW